MVKKKKLKSSIAYEGTQPLRFILQHVSVWVVWSLVKKKKIKAPSVIISTTLQRVLRPPPRSRQSCRPWIVLTRITDYLLGFNLPPGNTSLRMAWIKYPLEPRAHKGEKQKGLEEYSRRWVYALILESSRAASHEAAVNFSAYSTILNSWIDKHTHSRSFPVFLGSFIPRFAHSRLFREISRIARVFGRLFLQSTSPGDLFANAGLTAGAEIWASLLIAKVDNGFRGCASTRRQYEY